MEKIIVEGQILLIFDEETETYAGTLIDEDYKGVVVQGKTVDEVKTKIDDAIIVYDRAKELIKKNENN